MKKYLLFPLLLFALNTYAQTYTIPGATEQPAWVFPLWFEDALGNKDTLYFGYDPEAVDYGIPSPDTIFGEKFQLVDSSNFLTVWGGGGLYTDTGFYGRNVTVTTFESLYGDGIGFYSTWYPPLILRWDKNLFYSDVLPFPDNGDAPRAWGEIVTNGDMVPEGECSFQYPYIMTDTTQGSGLACYHADSMVFMYGSLAVLLFEIKPWRPYWTEVFENKNEHNSFQIFPNPIISESFQLHVNNTSQVHIEIFTIDSRPIYSSLLSGALDYTIPLTTNGSFFYLVRVTQNNSSQLLKLIRL